MMVPHRPRRARSRLLALLHCRRGVAAIEFAFVAPVLILMLLGIVELGRALLLYNDMQHVAGELARWSYINLNASRTQADESGARLELASAAGDYLIAIDVADVDVSRTTFSYGSGGACDGTAAAEIVLDYEYEPISGSLFPWAFRMTNRMTSPILCACPPAMLPGGGACP